MSELIPTDADYDTACKRLYFAEWAKIKKVATKVAAQREIENVQQRVAQLIEEGKSCSKENSPNSRLKFLQKHKKISELWKREDELLRIAYPDQYPVEEIVEREEG